MNRQRVGAYALACAEGRILLCRMSGRTPTPGRWTLPGGGPSNTASPLKHAALRELAEEEPGWRGTIIGLVWRPFELYVGPTSGDNIHGIRLIYQVDADGQPTHRESAGLDGQRPLDSTQRARRARSLRARPLCGGSPGRAS